MSSKPPAAAKVTRIARRQPDSATSVAEQQRAPPPSAEQPGTSSIRGDKEAQNSTQSRNPEKPSPMCAVSGILGDVLERQPVQPPADLLPVVPPSGSFPAVMHRKQSKVSVIRNRHHQREAACKQAPSASSAR